MIGIDIIEVSRIQKLISDDFFNKVFLKQEIDYFKTNNNNPEIIAGHFAAKEAVIKALLSEKDITFKQVQICHNEFGAPLVKLTDTALSKFNNMNASQINISISHTKTVATAVCVVTK